MYEKEEDYKKKHADITGDIDDSNTADDSESDDMMC